MNRFINRNQNTTIEQIAPSYNIASKLEKKNMASMVMKLMVM